MLYIGFIDSLFLLYRKRLLLVVVQLREMLVLSLIRNKNLVGSIGDCVLLGGSSERFWTVWETLELFRFFAIFRAAKSFHF